MIYVTKNSGFYAELYLSSDQWNNHIEPKAFQFISVKSIECAAVVYMDDWPIYLWISSDKWYNVNDMLWYVKNG